MRSYRLLETEAFSFGLKRMPESRRDCFRFPQESVKIRKTIKDVGQQRRSTQERQRQSGKQGGAGERWLQKETGHHCSDPFLINQGTHMETRKSCLTRFDCIPIRKGSRPSSIWGPLHIQCSGRGDTKYVRGLTNEFLTWPHVESTPPVVSSPDLISIHLKQARGAPRSSAATAVKE